MPLDTCCASCSDTANKYRIVLFILYALTMRQAEQLACLGCCGMREGLSAFVRASLASLLQAEQDGHETYMEGLQG